MGLGLVWAALGGSLLVATEYLQDTVSKYAAAPRVMSELSGITSGHMLTSLLHLMQLRSIESRWRVGRVSNESIIDHMMSLTQCSCCESCQAPGFAQPAHHITAGCLLMLPCT